MSELETTVMYHRNLTDSDSGSVSDSEESSGKLHARKKKATQLSVEDFLVNDNGSAQFYSLSSTGLADDTFATSSEDGFCTE